MKLAILAMAIAAFGAASTARPAELAGPERLATDLAGVVGSGDLLSLSLKTQGYERILKIGDVYEDGWTLRALTPTKATLTKDGTEREVGLNPTGQVAAAVSTAAPTIVDVTGLPSEATIQAYVDAALALDPLALEKAKHGQALTVEEARRSLAYRGMISDDLTRRMQNAGSARSVSISGEDQRAVLGDAGFSEYWAMEVKVRAFDRDQTLTDLAARPVTGPTSYYVLAGASQAAVISAQGIDNRGAWSSGAADSQGGRAYTLLAGTADQFAARVPAPKPMPMGAPITRNIVATPVAPVAQR
ncbi:MAG: hypothetical protein JWM33_2167 [Caulobacteraceae bacterium]|nr:hypothetical protein [Caulobacteraceae bacterium]